MVAINRDKLLKFNKNWQIWHGFFTLPETES